VRCPNHKCGRAIAVEATSCICGWRASAAPAPRAEVEPEATPLSEAKRQALHAQIRRTLAAMRTTSTDEPFDRWTRGMTQETVNLLVRQAIPDQAKDKCLARLREACVIDEKFRLIPVEQRQALREAARAERLRFEAELAERRRVAEAQVEDRA
jgi:hypothetical protein